MIDYPPFPCYCVDCDNRRLLAESARWNNAVEISPTPSTKGKP